MVSISTSDFFHDMLGEIECLKTVGLMRSRGSLRSGYWTIGLYELHNGYAGLAPLLLPRMCHRRGGASRQRTSQRA